jgi:hypothetical protein
MLFLTESIGSPKGSGLSGDLERVPGLGIRLWCSKVFGLTPIPSSFDV